MLKPYNLPAIFLSVAVCVSSVFSFSGPAQDAARSAETCGDPADAVPFYRLYYSPTVDHVYITDVNLINPAIQDGYSLETVPAMVFVTQEESTLPFYRLYNAAATDSFYTLNTTERDMALASGYVLQPSDPQTYIYPTQICGSVPFYRLYNSPSTDNFYTISETESIEAANQGYSYIGIAGYVLPQTAGDTQC
ncbi:hypothetical protein K438DRAFT_1760918 [Mycena galopus ATCC 62051]|nr:hypothetical protein K438DRAFT_1760918 [Mycena galopus ATCC 62051]